MPRGWVMPALGVAYSHSLREWGRAAGGELTPVRMAAVGAGTVGTYVLDHYHDPSSYSASRPAQVATLALCAAVTVGCCAADPALVVKFAAFALLAAWYDTPVPGCGLRWKALFPFSKTLFVPAMHVGWCVAVSEARVLAASNAYMFLYYVAINVAMDVKDVDADRRAGVTTVPNTLGAPATLTGLAVASSALAAAGVATGHGAAAFAFACLAGHLALYVGGSAPPNGVIYYAELWRVLGGAACGA